MRFGDVCREFNLHDQRIIWIRYVWDYFREKLDQRDDKELRAALEAADEVLWSCYRPYFDTRKTTSPPPPIACISYNYTPTALRTQFGHVLDRSVDKLTGPMKDYFKSLPVGVLRLPPTIVTAPWTLALVAHEVGHFLQDAVESGAQPGQTLADRAEEVARAAGGGEEDMASWRRWTAEIFADWIAVLVLGPWAVWALAPWVIVPDSAMLSRDTAYPSPLVRLYLVGRMVEQLGLNAGGQLSALGICREAATTKQSSLDVAIADGVAGLMVKPMGDCLDPLSLQLEFRKSDHDARDGDIAGWADCLLGRKTKQPVEELRAARVVTAGAVKAHHTLATGEDGATLRQKLDELAARAASMIAACHDKRKRALTDFRPAEPGRLARLILTAGEEDLKV
jgi:hypothetical protein